MSLERKDIRAKLDPDDHLGLCVLAEVDGLDIGEWIERVLVKVIRERIHTATLIAERVQRRGTSGSTRDRRAGDRVSDTEMNRIMSEEKPR